MIEAVTTSRIEAKAPRENKEFSSEKSSKSVNEKESFASELAEASSSKKSEKKSEEKSEETSEEKVAVGPVKVSAEQMMVSPSELLESQSGQLEGVKPSVFDPSLTKGVEKLNSPETTGIPSELSNEQLMKLLQGESLPETEAGKKMDISQLLMEAGKEAKASPGRGPAIDFAKSEIDPQLMNMDDFVAQKNLVAKKNLQASTNNYGMKPTPAQKMATENGLKQNQVIQDVGAGQNSSGMNSQQFILNMMNDQNAMPKVNDAQAPVKVFDMSNIKTENPNQIMNQISDYIIQAKAAKEPTVSMRVNHEELGTLDITVQKSMNAQGATEMMSVNIGAHSLEGKNFFELNSKDLLSHLGKAGISLSEFKVETPSQSAKNSFDTNDQSASGQRFAQDKNFSSEQNQRKHDADKRAELWKNLSDKEAA